MKLKVQSITLLFFLLVAAFSVRGQLERQSVKQTVLRKQSFALGFHIHNYGMGFDFRYSRRINDKLEHLATLAIGSFKDPKETRVESKFANTAIGKPYIFGKKNYCYVLGITYGLQFNLFRKTPTSKFNMNGGISMGPALAFLKPYYVEVIDSLNNVNPYAFNKESYPFNTSGQANTIYNYIVGESDYFQGFNKMKVVPGWRTKIDLTFNFSGTTLYIRALQLGINLDIYGKPIDMMDFADNRQIYLAGFLGVMLGNAW